MFRGINMKNQKTSIIEPENGSDLVLLHDLSSLVGQLNYQVHYVWVGSLTYNSEHRTYKFNKKIINPSIKPLFFIRVAHLFIATDGEKYMTLRPYNYGYQKNMLCVMAT